MKHKNRIRELDNKYTHTQSPNIPSIYTSFYSSMYLVIHSLLHPAFHFESLSFVSSTFSSSLTYALKPSIPAVLLFFSSLCPFSQSCGSITRSLLTSQVHHHERWIANVFWQSEGLNALSLNTHSVSSSG